MSFLHANDKTAVLSDRDVCLQGRDVSFRELVLRGDAVLPSHVNNTDGSSGGSGGIVMLKMLFGQLPLGLLTPFPSTSCDLTILAVQWSQNGRTT